MRPARGADISGVTAVDFARNVQQFFSDENRSMMGGWTRQEREVAEQEAGSLDGPEREAAQRAIQERLERERAEFGADYNADKPQ